MKTRRVGLFGGRFDPPHVGHLMAAQGAFETLGLDELYLVPAKTPSHKPAVASAEVRYTMCLLATLHHPHFQVSRLELERDGPSYSFDTVVRFKEDMTGDVFFIVGADAANDVSTWHRPLDLMNAAHMVAVTRPGYTLAPLEPPLGGRVRALLTRACEVSSTEVRERLKEGRSVRYLVPELVESYLAKHPLYRQ